MADFNYIKRGRVSCGSIMYNGPGFIFTVMESPIQLLFSLLGWCLACSQFHDLDRRFAKALTGFRVVCKSPVVGFFFLCTAFHVLHVFSAVLVVGPSFMCNHFGSLQIQLILLFLRVWLSEIFQLSWFQEIENFESKNMRKIFRTWKLNFKENVHVILNFKWYSH